MDKDHEMSRRSKENVSKRFGTRLRNLMVGTGKIFTPKTEKKMKISSFGGAGKLTNDAIDHLSWY